MQIAIRSTPENTSLQVQTCLNVLVNLERMVEKESGGLGTQTTVELDDNVRTCLEATIINATNRLDKILADDARWELPPDAMKHADTSLALQNAMLSHEMRVSAMRLEHLQRGQAAVFAKQEQPAPEVEVEPETPKPTRKKRK